MTALAQRPAIVLDECIDWPNGLGFTPCSTLYREKFDEREAIKPDYVNLDDLSPEDHNRYCRLENELANLQAEGHLGPGERW